MLVSKWAYRFRGYLVTPPLIFALFCSHYEMEADLLIWPLGLFLFLLGVALRIWAQEHLHYRLRVRKSLTITGPYSFVRNPMYVGNILICLGATITSELLWFVPITLFYCLGIYSLVVRYEESHLLDKYGESYRRYKVEVPRWFPRSLSLKNISLINEYIRQSVVTEIHCTLLVLLFILKEIIN